MTDNTLVTFLGRTPNVAGQGYRRTKYEFADGHKTESVAFFGWAMQQRLNPSKMVILGTAGSIWDHLFEGDIDIDGAWDLREELEQAVHEKAVSADQLNSLAPMLANKLACEVDLVLIPYCQSSEEQVELLKIMADHIHDHDTVHLDITHGFRHLPMLAFLSALHLRIAKKAKIAGIWYGAYDPDSNRAPVHDLSGLLMIADWLQALSGFDNNGDYRAIATMLESTQVDPSITEGLKQAAFYENILSVGPATGALNKVLPELRNTRTMTPEVELVMPLVRSRLEWVAEKKQFQKQIRLGKESLARQDYLRAVLYIFESLITRLCQLRSVDNNDYDGRELARKEYEAELLLDKGSKQRKQYQLLKSLRNQLAHGTRGSKREIQQILLSEDKIQQTLEELIQEIDSGRLPDANTVTRSSGILVNQ